MIRKLEDTGRVAALFDNWPETMIWACLQKIMGNIYADDAEQPDSAMAVLGDFVFFAGRADKALIMYYLEAIFRDFTIMVPKTEKWAAAVEACCGSRAKRTIRYAFKKESDNFNRKRLLAAAGSLKPGYKLKMIDGCLYEQCKSEVWSRDLVSQFSSSEEYQRLGLGVGVLKDGVLVSGASAYARYEEGIEIEIDTKASYRRQGLAYACGAKLILECLERGLYPSWDAQNKVSAALALKLGYHFSNEYPVFEVCSDSI